MPLFDSLENLPIFEGRSDDATRRALLTAGLALMQPQDPLSSSPTLGALSQGISAGLGSLDQTTATEQAVEQQGFQNIITGRQIAATEEQAAAATTRAEADTTRAESTQQQAETAAESLTFELEKFEDLETLRTAEINLKEAEAAWLARRHPGGAAGSSSAKLEQARIEATIQVLVSQDPERYRLADGSVNTALARVDAYKAIGIDDEIIKNESLGIILQNAEEGAEVRSTIEGLTTDFGPPVTETPVEKVIPPTTSLKEGVGRTFEGVEGVWTLRDGKAFRVR